MKAKITWLLEDEEEPIPDLPEYVNVPAIVSLDDMAEYISHHYGRLCSLEFEEGVRVWQGKTYRYAGN